MKSPDPNRPQELRPITFRGGLRTDGLNFSRLNPAENGCLHFSIHHASRPAVIRFNGTAA
jgi:hypothetical protein